MIKEIDITNGEKAREVLEIQLPAYMAEAQLIDFYEIPALKDTVETLQQCGETFYGFFENGGLRGAVSFKKAEKTIDIHRLVVHTDYFRKGIANQLLSYLEERNPEAEALVVSTGCENEPAIRFYEKHGFQKTGEQQVAENLKTSQFRKEIGRIPADVKQVVHEHVGIIDSRLKGFLDSYYLTGSISMGAFTAGQSDIDFFAVINREATLADSQVLKEIHAYIHKKYPNLVLDGFYVQKAGIESNEDEWACLRFNDGEFHGDVKYGRHSIDAYQLAKYGVAIKGREISGLCIPIDWNSLLAGMKNNLNTYWVDWLRKSNTFPTTHYFGLFFSVKEIEWGVLGVSRLFYTFREKDIETKTGAGEYALKAVPAKWQKILHESLRLRKGIKHSYYGSVFQRRRDALEYIEYMIQEINDFTRKDR